MEQYSSQLPPVAKTPTRLPEVTLEDKVKLIISTKAYTKISYLVQKIHNVEWSALLFYTAKGHITSPKEMICRVEDIYLMDKGTGAHTSHDYNNNDVMKAFDTHPEYMDMKLGHIHSHNTMGKYFSYFNIF